ncbi:conserved hypothetical protein [Aeropyrum pernix K1]|uniref:Probable queuosine precursor transporter n=1 Tax=Aeropyrum pernix (strain ATCC 700893 / DSM 11879 / JCM 9820 / NBRC 100138 / K1) TaxID=272557 RepID=Q9YA29_AERPE|nr:queuosine precursor transporter [Aeropyrum pernix]BAA81121.1 conserved hypothetical protein [Aeropyrum pernix K1]
MEGGEKLDRSVWPLVLAAAVFSVALVSANYLSAKLFLVEIPGLITLVGPAGVVAYSVTFIVTDVVSEVYGRRAAGAVVAAGFASQIVALFLTAVAIASPPAPFSLVQQEEYAKVVMAGFNIIVASLVAYIVSQYHDVWAFHFWKKMTGSRWLWLRNNLSTWVSQLIDTVVFLSLAFYIIPLLSPEASRVEPVSLSTLWAMIYSQYIIKLGIAVLDTPVVYLGVYLVKNYIESGLQVQPRMLGIITGR